MQNYIPKKPQDVPLQMKIILTDDIPVSQRPRRLSIKEQNEVNKQIGNISRSMLQSLCH